MSGLMASCDPLHSPGADPGGQPVFSPAPSPQSQAPSSPAPDCSAPIPPTAFCLSSHLPCTLPSNPPGAPAAVSTCTESLALLVLLVPLSCHPAPHRSLLYLELPSTEWYLEWMSAQLTPEIPREAASSLLPPLSQLSSPRRTPVQCSRFSRLSLLLHPPP